MLKKKETNAFLKGTISLSLAAIITKLLGVMYKVPLSYILGDEGMGYFNTAYAVYGFFYILCTAGVPKAVSLILGEYEEDEASCTYILKKSTSIFLKVGIIACITMILLAPALVHIIGSKKSLYTVIAIAPSIIFVSISGVLRGYLNTEGNLVALALSQFFEAMIKLVSGLVLAWLGYNLRLQLSMIAALAVFGITLASIASCVYLYIRAFIPKRGDIAKQSVSISDKTLRRRIGKIALPIAISSSVLNLSSMIDLAFIMQRLTDIGYSEGTANALYGNYTTLAVPMMNLVMALVTPIALAYFPKLSSYAYRGENREYSDCFKTLLHIVSLISVPSFCVFLFYGFDVLDILFASYSSAVGAEMLSALSLGIYLLSALTVVNTGLEARGKIAITVVSLFIGSVVKSVVTYVLIGNSTFGMLGAPIGTVASYLVSLTISITAFYHYCGKVNLCRFILLEPIVGFVSFCIPYKFVYTEGVFKNTFFSLFASVAISSFIYILLEFFMHLRGLKGFNIKYAQKSAIDIGKLDENN